MIDDRQDELAALHALDLLEGPERDEFLAELAGNAELQRRVASLRRAATELALFSPPAEPPAALKARILASIEREEMERPRAERADIPEKGVRIAFPAWVPWLAAACIGIAAIWSESHYIAARNEIASLLEQQRISQVALNETRAELGSARALLTDSRRKISDLAAQLKAEGDLAHFKISTLASMLGNTPSALAVAVWDPAREQGVLAVSKLPFPASDKDYQLWVIDAKYPSPVSAGTFVVDPVTGEAHVVFRADHPVNAVAKFAVSLERKGGSPKAEGPIVLLSQ